jgi:hypothetical protein
MRAGGPNEHNVETAVSQLQSKLLTLTARPTRHHCPTVRVRGTARRTILSVQLGDLSQAKKVAYEIGCLHQDSNDLDNHNYHANDYQEFQKSVDSHHQQLGSVLMLRRVDIFSFALTH